MSVRALIEVTMASEGVAGDGSVIFNDPPGCLLTSTLAVHSSENMVKRYSLHTSTCTTRLTIVRSRVPTLAHEAIPCPGTAGTIELRVGRKRHSMCLSCSVY